MNYSTKQILQGHICVPQSSPSPQSLPFDGKAYPGTSMCVSLAQQRSTVIETFYAVSLATLAPAAFCTGP
jgi:hypothetical protein